MMNDATSVEEAPNAGTYEDTSLVRVVVEKHRVLREQFRSGIPTVTEASLRTLAAAGLAAHGDRLNVLDFGGSAGYHYFVVKAALGDKLKIKWNVVETKAMVTEANRIFSDETELAFFDNIVEAQRDLGDVDIVFASGALQYCPDPFAYLRQLIDVGAKKMFITKAALNEEDETLTMMQSSSLLANGPGPLPDGVENRRVEYPVTFVGRGIFETILQSAYGIKLFIVENRNVHTVGNVQISLYGYYCERRSSGVSLEYH